MRKQYPDALQQIDRTYVLWRGRKLSYFAGCDYLRLSSHPGVLKAARDCLHKFGLNVAASRKTTGNHQVYGELERATKRFFAADAAIITSTGYFTNIIAAQGLRGAIDLVLIDERAHGSLRDAAAALCCPLIDFRHLEPDDLRTKLSSEVPRHRIALMTDGMFSHNGAVAPLSVYRKILGPNALLWVDDAHAAGILGKSGRGTVEVAGLTRKSLLQTVTFSKAFGTYGGAILCSEQIALSIAEKSAAVGGNTPTPLPLAYATVASLMLCNPSLRKRLFSNIDFFWKLLGADGPKSRSPIVSFAPAKTFTLRRNLLQAGIFPSLIRYPGGPENGYFRFALSSEHSRRQISALAEVLAPFANTSLSQ